MRYIEAMSEPDATTEAGGRWPTRADTPEYLVRTEDTLVGAPPPVPPPAPAPLAPPPPDRRIGAGMLLALAVVAVAGAGVAIAWLLTHRGSSPQRQARTVLVTTGAATTHAKAGGSPMLVAVPHLVGGQLTDAQQTLAGLGFGVTVKHVTSSRPAGTVLDQAPATGANARHGSKVALTVAASAPTQSTTAATTTAQATTTAPTTTTAPPEPQTATVPDVSGQDEASAVQTLVAAGILPSLVFVPAQGKLGTVVQLAKPAGTGVPYHAHVQVNLSTGPGHKPLEQVPNVLGKSLDDAVTALQAAKLRLIFVKVPVSSRASAGKVVQQTPAGGEAPHNAQVLVFLGAYSS